MDIRQLTPTYFVAPQIAPDMLPALKEAGITRILCNRPDAEVPPALSAEAIAGACAAAELEFAVQPLTHQTMTPDVIAQNHALGAQRDGVTLAYCASGTRSCIAWALGEAGTRPAEEIITAGRQAGYDLEQLRGYLSQADAG
ncbi:TIGR01244 family phosphatase [Sulfitobacter albidus]|uniref:TIGR01244 family phosphatase n=1 Tax=Sulfitobacter albidus TaxID=2829501 RepID=A0A975JFR3_9RHOB|nr:TIGR01244 family sulfur transferase [Sulfitobacter albidus]QUJ77381.1 TIGR01244 family phosphatase [Sulfitobacter albidus]